MSHSYSVSPTGTRETSSPCAIERGTAILARRLLGVVQRRDALGKRADVREPLVAVLPPPLVAPPVRRILEEGDPVDEPACDLGEKVHEGGLFICGPRESKIMPDERESDENGNTDTIRP